MKNTDWHWIPKRKKRTAKEKIVPVKFYCSKPWIRARTAILADQPFCEVSEHFGKHQWKDLDIDHLIPIEMGGALFRPENLMVMTSSWHGRKSNLERLKAEPLIEAQPTADGLIPINRSDIFEALEKKSSPEHSASCVW